MGRTYAARRLDGNVSLGVIAMRVLNDVLRPTLSVWHPALRTMRLAGRTMSHSGPLGVDVVPARRVSS